MSSTPRYDLPVTVPTPTSGTHAANKTYVDTATPAVHHTRHSSGGADAIAPSDIGAVATGRLVSSGTGLTGGGDLSADRTLAVSYGSSAGTACQGNDSRLSDARTPTAHASSHNPGGSDALSIPAFSGYNSTAMTVQNTSFSGIGLNNEQLDSHNWHSTSSNTERYTPQVAGWYQVECYVNKDSGWSTGNVAACILKNGSLVKGGADFNTAASVLRSTNSRLVFCNGSTDYVSFCCYQDSGTSQSLTIVDGSSSGMDVFFVRPA